MALSLNISWKRHLNEKCDWTTFMVHFISAIETEIGRSMESIAAVNFLAFPVSFDLLDKGMDFGLKSKKDNLEFVDSTCLCFFPCAWDIRALITIFPMLIWQLLQNMQIASCGSFPFFSHLSYLSSCNQLAWKEVLPCVLLSEKTLQALL